MLIGIPDHGLRDLGATRALFAPLGREAGEVAALAYLDPNWTILGLRHLVGTPTSVTIPVRTIVTDALAFDAHGVVMAHNHPSGDATPSEEDIVFTRALAKALYVLGITLFDHVVLAGDRIVSLRAMGVI